jgi:alkanesulfonate monooxygenase SsuD/methylene tetrahydromethanopterin reductase-like flavin-dependent oxidoreductase (luciferase family)
MTTDTVSGSERLGSPAGPVDQPAIGYAPTRPHIGGDGLRQVVRLSETAGLDHIAVGDHVSFHVGAGSDGLLSAASLLVLSERLAANTAVYLLPLRHPVLVARQLADIAQLAPGRFTFGVGIGGEDPHEVEVCGVDPKSRGRRMDDCMRIVRQLLRGDPVDYDGEFFRLERAQIAPAPTQPIPMVVGGRSDAAVARAGRLGDGWIGVWVSSGRFAQAVAQMREAAAGSGRPEPRWRNGLNVWCGVGRDSTEARGFVAPAMEAFYRLPYESFERWSPAGTPEQLAEFLIPYVKAGCSIFNLILNGTSPEAEIEAAGEIRRLMRTAVA